MPRSGDGCGVVARAGHGVVAVDNAGNARIEGYVGTGQLVWIAAAIKAFMVVADGGEYIDGQGQTSSSRDNPELNMAAGFGVLGTGQFCGFAQQCSRAGLIYLCPLAGRRVPAEIARLYLNPVGGP